MNFLKITLLALFVNLTACDPDSSSPNGNTPASGKWKVSYFFDKQDKSSYYANYTFEFESNGTLTATNGGQNWAGIWQTGVDDSKNKFVIDFNGSVPSALGELEEDWLIISMDANLMHFEHLSGGNGDTDIVKFVK